MEHTGHCYDDLARKYAALNDQKPWYTCYERPATISLLPALEGLNVLDAACGPGWYCEYLHRHGARVTACDLNAEFVEMARTRAGADARVVQADLTQPLSFAEDAAFDLVLCTLALHYLRDWVPTLREFHRVLKPEGRLVFSTHHSFADYQAFSVPDYFGTQIIDDYFTDIGPVRYFRRPLTAIFDALGEAGFLVERLLEPQPTDGFQQADPKGYDKVRLSPIFIMMRARKV